MKHLIDKIFLELGLLYHKSRRSTRGISCFFEIFIEFSKGAKAVVAESERKRALNFGGMP
jgi:hypothetical protein